MNIGKLTDRIFSISKEKEFEEMALEIFLHQYKTNIFYKKYVDALSIKIETIQMMEEIPFLPIQFFKSQKIVCGSFVEEAVFTSSGTTGTINSHHFVKDAALYVKSFVNCFEHFYGNIDEYCILGLLPSYLERTGSSLVRMVDEMIQLSGNVKSGFYLYDFEQLFQTITAQESAGKKTLLIGVTYALLDFAEQYSIPLKNTLIMETGGMKGKRAEMVRNEIHEVLKKSFSVDKIHSEYGMTELLSQAYSKGDGHFFTPAWMKVLLRKEDDPFDIGNNKKGIINIIDLANIHSCSFIATDDVGSINQDGSFEVLGRVDHADIRGCSLLYL